MNLYWSANRTRQKFSEDLSIKKGFLSPRMLRAPPYIIVHCKKRLLIFLSTAGMSLTKLSHWPGIIKLFPASRSLVSDIPSGDWKTVGLFLQCYQQGTGLIRWILVLSLMSYHLTVFFYYLTMLYSTSWLYWFHVKVFIFYTRGDSLDIHLILIRMGWSQINFIVGGFLTIKDAT